MKTTNQLPQDHQEPPGAGYSEIRSSGLAERSDQNGRGLPTLLDFLKTFADRCHHGKEENVLFPTLMQAGIPMNGGRSVMLYEHDRARQLIREMEYRHPADFARYAQIDRPAPQGPHRQ